MWQANWGPGARIFLIIFVFMECLPWKMLKTDIAGILIKALSSDPV